jgi:hypothetical protein
MGKVAPAAALAIGLLALAGGATRLGQLSRNRRRVSS